MLLDRHQLFQLAAYANAYAAGTPPAEDDVRMFLRIAYDDASGLLLLPDASEGLRRFTLTEASATEGTSVPLGTSRGLAPRHVALVGR